LTYFSLLGISEDAGQEELEARYQELAEYLASPNLPANMRDWAAKQATLVDEAYAVLADPEPRARGGAPRGGQRGPPRGRSPRTKGRRRGLPCRRRCCAACASSRWPSASS